MFEHKQLTVCQQRKSALLQQSAAHRVALLSEAQNLRPVTEWVDAGIKVARKARTGWSVLAPLLSLWRTRKQESSGSVHRFIEVCSRVRSVTEAWKRRC